LLAALGGAPAAGPLAGRAQPLIPCSERRNLQ
jgi:hypothetical protein